jgi:hypothetical protein
MRRVCVALLASLPLIWAGSARAEVVVAISKSEHRLSVLLDGADRALVRQAARTLREPHPALRNVASDDNTRVLREREAWLRGLDRRSGVVR